MAEYMGMTFTFGGELPAGLLKEFTKAISDDLSEINGPSDEEGLRKEAKRKKPIKLYAMSNYGECDDLKAFCKEHGLGYIHTSEASTEYDGYIKYWVPGMKEEVSHFSTQGGDPTLPVETIHPLVVLLLEYAKKGKDILPLFISNKDEGIKEVVEKGLKDAKKFLPALEEKLQSLLPEVPELPPFTIKE